MRIHYQTAIATLIQFVTLSLLGVANASVSIVSTCTNKSTSNDCLSNVPISLIFFLLTAGWFAFVWVLGYAAQDRRSKRLAQALIAVEAFIGLVALFNLKHHTDVLSLITSLLDISLVIWIIILAFRLMRSGGGRIVKSQSRGRARRRPVPRS